MPMQIGWYTRLRPGSELHVRVDQVRHVYRDAMLWLGRHHRGGRGLADHTIRIYRQRIRESVSELANLEVAVRRQGRVAGALLRSPSLVSVLKHFTVGFELETHATAGLDRNSISEATVSANSDRPIDPRRHAAWVRRTVHQELGSTDALQRRLTEPAIQEAVALAVFKEWARSAPADAQDGAAALLASGHWRSFMPPITLQKLNEYCITLRLSFRRLTELGCLPRAGLTALIAEREVHYWRQPVPDDVRVGRNYRGVELVEDLIPNFDKKLLQVGSDASVRGFEIRTNGALTIPQFIRAANIAFGAEHVIDTGCSFHLHVGVRGVALTYTQTFQSALMEYLLDNIDKVPESVLERWELLSGDSPIARYFRPHITTEKYSFVHYHTRCGTWEFRCFGNVTNKRDAVRCLRLALRAMLHAYQVTRADRAPIVQHGDVNNKLGREIIKCITKREPLSKVIAAARRA